MKHILYAQAFLLCSATALLSRDLVLHYTFNNDSGEFDNVQDMSGNHFDGEIRDFIGSNMQPSSTMTEPGVTGAAGDFAFSNRTATGMGGFDHRGGAVMWSGPIDLAFRSFTVLFWYKTPAGIHVDNGARVIFLGSDTGYVEIRFGPENTAQIVLTGMHQRFSEDVFQGSGEWYFFAVTFDAGAPEHERIHFYRGGKDVEVQAAGIQPSHLQGVDLHSESGNLVIGSFSGKRGQSPFQAAIDEIRIYGSQDDGGGALSMDELEKLRRSIVSP